MKRTSLTKRIAAAWKLVFGFYEGAQHTTSRSWLWGGVQDARKDITKSTRLELIRRSRYFEKNNALANKLGLLFEQYTVGSDGLQITPATSSPDFNAEAAEYWSNSARFIDIEGNAGFGSFQGKSAWRWFFDGEFYWLKTRGASGYARLQGIEAHRIATPEGLKEREDIVDGVRIDPQTGRPLAYYIDDKPVDAALMIPIMEKSRAMQCRSLPFLTPVLNDLHDLDDLTALEMLNAKAHAEHQALFVTNDTGEGDLEDLVRQGMTITNGDTTSGEDEEARTEYYRNAIGGRILYGKNGEKVESVGNNNPSAAQQWFHETKVSQICAGVGISKLLVYPWSIQGTVTRADLDAQAAYFRARSMIMAEAVTLAYEFIMADAVAKKRLRTPAPADFRKSAVRPPRGVNVDVGRNSNAMLAELKAGTRTFQSVYAELGLDWRQELSQKADEAEFIAKLAQDRGLSPQLISDVILQQIAKEEAKAA